MIAQNSATTRAASAHSPRHAVDSQLGGNAAADVSEANLDQMTRLEQCNYLLSRQPLSILGTFVASFLVVIALSNTSSLRGALIWFVAVSLNQVRRIAIYFRHQRDGVEERKLGAREARTFWSTLLTGCLFGATPVLFWSAGLHAQLALTIIAFSVILAASQITISYAHIGELLILSAMLPFVARNAFEGTRYSYFIAALELAAIFFALMATRRVSAMWKDSLRNRLRNQMLVGQLEHEATHDMLTGLPNRTVFFDRLQHVIARAGRQDVKCAVVYFDLDRFKLVNDTYGHHVGDDLLRRVADSVGAITREGDSFCRLAGDEFAVLAEEVASPDGAIRIAENIQAAVRSVENVAGHPFDISASIGIAMFPHSNADENAESVIARADMAMYVSKKNGRGRHTLYRDSFDTDYADFKRGSGVGNIQSTSAIKA